MSRQTGRNYHNQGQKDASEGNYDPPHERPFSVIGEIIIPHSDREIKDRDEYREGYRATKNQLKRS